MDIYLHFTDNILKSKVIWYNAIMARSNDTDILISNFR